MKFEEKIIGVLVGLIAFLIAMLIHVSQSVTSLNQSVTSLKREAIERNFAEYNSTNGVWQWKAK